jgi:hypothetical protein
MRVLFVCPVDIGSGETITSIHFAEDLLASGHDVAFIASPFAERFIGAALPVPVHLFSDIGSDNFRLWRTTVADFIPDVIVFADYPLMFFPLGVVPLARVPGWVDSLIELGARLVTLDHFGFAQGKRTLFLGPPHLGLGMLVLPALPDGMEVMLPCPMHEPGPVDGRIGHPFRYWDVPFRLPPGLKEQTRSRYLDSEDGLLVFYAVPNWAWRYAERHRITLYDHLPKLFSDFFSGYEKPVTLVSVNNGRLFDVGDDPRLRIINLGPCPKADFEALLFAADLAVTDNKLSISIGKAICGFQASAVLKNSFGVLELMDRAEGTAREIVRRMERTRIGSVYPFDAFPTVTPKDVDQIGLYRDNGLPEGFLEVEVFGGAETREKLLSLAGDPVRRAEQRARQEIYVERLAKLPTGEAVLRSVC